MKIKKDDKLTIMTEEHGEVWGRATAVLDHVNSQTIFFVPWEHNGGKTGMGGFQIRPFSFNHNPFSKESAIKSVNDVQYEADVNLSKPMRP